MATMQSTVQRVAAEEAAQNQPADDGWKPAGSVLVEDEAAMREALGAQENPRQLGVPPEPRADVPNLPGIGHIVVYHLRDGDSRNRRSKFPAIVMDVDEAAGELKLWVIVDDGDTWMQDRVPARVSPEPGWELVAPPRDGPNELIVRLGYRVAELEDRMTMLGIAELEARIEALEDHPAVSVPPLDPLVPAGTKRGPGRPKKG